MARDIALTLAGGGNRALVQLGVLREWWPRLEPRIAAVATCSAGASMAVSTLSGRELLASAYWFGRRAGVSHNFSWGRLLRGRRPTPHTPIYRDTVRYALRDGGLERIQALPFPLLVLSARPPRLLPAPVAALVGMTAYSAERKLRYGKLHPSIGRRIGFTPDVVDLRACRAVEEVVDAVLASSSTPPFTPIGRMGGESRLDGGLVDNAPAFLAETLPNVKRHLVLLTRPYPPASVGQQGNRWYLCPSEPVPINRWEYTRPELAGPTIDVGTRTARAHDHQLGEFLDGG